MGARGQTPWRYLSNGAKMHINNNASISLSIKTPLFSLWRAKKKAQGLITPLSYCHSID